MKASQLEQGRTYTDKTLSIKRTIREIAKPHDDHRVHVFFGEAGMLKRLPIQEFAKWARTKVQ